MSTDDQAMLQAKAHTEATGHRTALGTYDGRWRRQADPVPAKRWPPNLALCHLPQCQPLGVQQVQGTNIPGPGARPVGSNGSQHGVTYIQNYASPDGTKLVQAYQCAEGCPVSRFDAQAGERATHSTGTHARSEYTNRGMFTGLTGGDRVSLGDTGPASRFFHVSDWSLDVAEQLAQADPVHYCAKASAAERHAGTGGRNLHPCIKPLALIRWLATLLLPPAAYAPRRLLVPFCGTGSEMIGGILAGWETVLGIEREASSVTVAEHRLAWWTGMRPQLSALPQSESPVVAPAAYQTQLSLL